jgi:hypothetical protein
MDWLNDIELYHMFEQFTGLNEYMSFPEKALVSLNCDPGLIQLE